MSGWIFNASPLILLGKIGQLPLVGTLSPEFRIPSAVVQELEEGGAEDPAVKWVSTPAIQEHVVMAPPPPQTLVQWDLGQGETAVLSLALERKGSVVVLDDLAARRFAISFGIPVAGTLGLLIRARQKGIITHLAPQIDGLMAHGARLSNGLIQHALKIAGETP